jgi:hypothetical protein
LNGQAVQCCGASVQAHNGAALSNAVE